MEISANAALAIRREQEQGYRGSLLVNDPGASLVFICRVHADTVDLLATIPCDQADKPPELHVMDSTIPEDATPEQAAEIALAELRRKIYRAVN
jgi:hypothetical protein